MKRLFILALLALCGCSHLWAPQISHPGNLAGSYFNQGHDHKSNLYLSADGRGAILTINNDGSFKLLTKFQWGIADGQFYTMNMSFTDDQKRVAKGFRDYHTAYDFSGSAIRTRLASGEWLVWQRTSDKPDLSVINSLPHG